MKTGSSWWLAGVIAAHSNRQVVGRTRLQKTVKLLQRKGLPTDYLYTIFFYGPYSEDVHADVRSLEAQGLIREVERQNQEGTPYYILQATEEAVLPEIEPFQPFIDLMEKADPVVLELAATYDTFREMDYDHAQALAFLRQKKGPKCDGGREKKALELLVQLKLLPEGEMQQKQTATTA
jgi:uncharacterized protein YwgA